MNLFWGLLAEELGNYVQLRDLEASWPSGYGMFGLEHTTPLMDNADGVVQNQVTRNPGFARHTPNRFL